MVLSRTPGIRARREVPALSPGLGFGRVAASFELRTARASSYVKDFRTQHLALASRYRAHRQVSKQAASASPTLLLTKPKWLKPKAKSFLNHGRHKWIKNL